MNAREKWQSLQGLLAQARSRADAGDRAGALTLVEQALEIDPSFLAAHSLREHLASPDAPDAAPRPTPKTTVSDDSRSGGISAFEAKVLARRAERRLGTAADAIGRRDFAVAAAALDEARELGADPGQLLRLERALAESRRRRPRRILTMRRVVAAATVVAGVLAARYVDDHLTDAGKPQTVPAAAASPSEDALGTAGVARPSSEVIKLQPTTRKTAAPAPEASAEPSRAAAPGTHEPAFAPTGPVSVATLPPPPAMAVSSPIGPIAPPAPVEPPARAPLNASSATTIAPAPLSLPTGQLVASPSRPIDEEVGVRDALQRYRAAYDALNARSARAVYPAVDERALARAFDNLAAQQLRFEACDVSVRGDAATARCRGTASYTPKFGSGDTQVEPRTWSFTLRKDAGQWAIQAARVER